MKTVLYIVFVLGLSLTSYAEPIDITFEQSKSWKGIFDAGFRPKHLNSWCNIASVN